MKIPILAVSLTALLSSTALAQTGQPSPGSSPPSTGAASSKASTERSASTDLIPVAAARALAGDTVLDPSGEPVGELEYLMVGVNDGTVRYAIIDPEQGADDQLAPVPWDALRVSGTGGDASLAVDRQRLDQQPKFTREQLGDLTQPAVVTSVYQYWAPVREQIREQNTSQSQRSESQAQPGSQPQASKPQGGKQGDSAAQQGKQAAGTPDQAQGEPHLLVGREVITTVLPPAFKTTREIRGSEVYTRDEQEYGEIDNLVIDLKGGRVAYVQVGHGGFLGLGEEITPVPYEALTYDMERNAYRLARSKAELEKVQSFARGDEPTSIKRSELGKLYKDFGVQPYWQEKS